MSPIPKRDTRWITNRRLALGALLVVALLVAAASLSLAQVIGITTTFTSNNGNAGNMFDVEATNGINIVGFDIHTSSTGAETVSVYYKSGTYKGFETTSGAWTLLGTDEVTGAGLGNPTPVDIGGLVIPAGETYALYVTLDSTNIRYTNGTDTYSDANVALDLGAGLGPNFTALVPSRTWNGTIYYERTNTPPVANDDYGVDYTTDEDTAFTTGNVLDNDTDADGDDLTIIAVDDSGLLGALSPNDNDTFDYDPNGQFEYLGDGELATDVFTYTISDGIDGTDWATVTITVTGINDPPVAVDDEGTGFTTDEETAFTTVNVKANDSDPEDDTLTVVDYDASGVVGLLTPVGDGTFDYDPNGQFGYLGEGASASDVFTYTLSDGVLTDTATVTITITGINGPPVAVDDEGTGYETDEDTDITTGNVLNNDTDPEDDELSVDSFDTTDTQGTVTDLGNGTFTYDPDGQFDYLGDADDAVDTFMYTVSDGALTDTATVSITIAGINDAPVAVDDEGSLFTTDENTIFTTGNVMDNDYDPETDPLTLVDYDTIGTLGDVTNNGNGTFDYDPDGQFEALGAGETGTDTFVYTITDGSLTATATVTITVEGVNAPPVALDDEYVTAYDTPKTVPVEDGVLDNDTDVDGDTLTAVLDSDPDGELDLNPDGSFVYTPTTGFEGEDTFTYHAFDGLAASNVATVTINVLDPTAADLEMEKVADADTPIEGDTLVYTLTVTNNGPADATGIEISDTLPSGVTYVADDGGGDYDGATWAAGDLIADASAMLHITVTVDADTTGTTITNTAVISASDQEDPLPGNDEAQAVITVVLPQSDLELSKDVDKPTPDEKGSIVYTLMVTNNGPRDATGVAVSDTLPSGVTYVDDDGGGAYDGAVWEVGDLDVDASATLRITATVDVGTAGTTITNTAVISDLDQVDPDPANDEAEAAIAVRKGPAVIAVSPEDGAMDVALDEAIVITFNRAINTETFNYTVTPDPGGRSEVWSSGAMTVTITHAGFAVWTDYIVRVTGAQDLAGNPLEQTYVWTFETEPIRTFMPIVAKRWAHPSNRR